jgi:hypothetical protein
LQTPIPAWRRSFEKDRFHFRELIEIIDHAANHRAVKALIIKLPTALAMGMSHIQVRIVFPFLLFDLLLFCSRSRFHLLKRCIGTESGIEAICCERKTNNCIC